MQRTDRISPPSKDTSSIFIPTVGTEERLPQRSTERKFIRAIEWSRVKSSNLRLSPKAENVRTRGLSKAGVLRQEAELREAIRRRYGF